MDPKKSFLWWVGNFGTTEVWKSFSLIQRTNRSEVGIYRHRPPTVLSDKQYMWKDLTDFLNSLA